MSKIKSNGLNQSGTQHPISVAVAPHSTDCIHFFNTLLYQFNGWDLKTQLFKFSPSRHQQDRGILLEAKAKAPRFEAEAVKIASRGEARLQCLKAPHHWDLFKKSRMTAAVTIYP